MHCEPILSHSQDRLRSCMAIATTSRSTSQSTARATVCSQTSHALKPSAPATPTGSAHGLTLPTPTSLYSSLASYRRTCNKKLASRWTAVKLVAGPPDVLHQNCETGKGPMLTLLSC